LLFAYVLKCYVELAPRILLHPGRHTDPARLRKPFKSRRDVDAITEDVATVDHHIANIDGDAKLDPFLLWHVDVSLSHALLDIDRTTHRIHYAAELGQQPVSGGLDNSPTMLSNLRIDQGAQVILELGVGTLLIQASQAAVSDHIGCQDRGKTSLYSL